MSLVKSIKHKSYLIATTKHQKHRNHLKYNLKVSSFECTIRLKILRILLSKIVEKLSFKKLHYRVWATRKNPPLFPLTLRGKGSGSSHNRITSKKLFLTESGISYHHIFIQQTKGSVLQRFRSLSRIYFEKRGFEKQPTPKSEYSATKIWGSSFFTNVAAISMK